MEAPTWILRHLQGPADLLTFAACLVLGLGMIDDYRRYGTRIQIAGGSGTLRLYAWYGAFVSCLSVPFLLNALTSWPVPPAVGAVMSVVTACLGWITIVLSLRAKRAGEVTWKRADVDAALANFDQALVASSAATKQLQKEVRRAQRRGGGKDGG